jgi:uncharacterized cupredoxin-like copper-binding protein
MQIRFIPTMALALGLAVTTACAGPAVTAAPAPIQAVAGANGVQQLTVQVGQGVAFNPSAIAVKAGQPVEITLRSTGGGEHDFYLEHGVAQPVKIVARGGQTARGTFTIESPGTYEFVCTVPGHALAGMRGTITAVAQ